MRRTSVQDLNYKALLSSIRRASDRSTQQILDGDMHAATMRVERADRLRKRIAATTLHADDRNELLCLVVEVES